MATKKYRLGLMLAVLMLNLVFSQVSLAQDPVEVGPDVYKKDFENERIRVLEFNFAPGASIAMHSHPDHVMYILSGGTLKLSYPDGHTNEMAAKTGDVIWLNAETHAAENIGTTDVHGVVVELKP